MPYPEFLIAPMREELTDVGFTELRTAAEVDRAVTAKGTTLVVVNSVCGVSARIWFSISSTGGVLPSDAKGLSAAPSRSGSARRRPSSPARPT